MDVELNKPIKPIIEKDYKVTAIVLVYNDLYLEKCLESLVNQTLDDLEILLVNDASTDDSLSICRKFEKEYSNVFIIDK
ncbi:MAG: glycosyltransferase, partial [Methanobrevibacter sp.]|nr:glycosyltransferase [Methanobrevibacter sp.]